MLLINIFRYSMWNFIWIKRYIYVTPNFWKITIFLYNRIYEKNISLIICLYIILGVFKHTSIFECLCKNNDSSWRKSAYMSWALCTIRCIFETRYTDFFLSFSRVYTDKNIFWEDYRNKYSSYEYISSHML